MKYLPLLLSALLLAVLTSPSHASQATDDIKATTDSILSLLNNPSLQGDSKKTERREQLRKELDRRFNWATSARSCLGRQWAKRTPAEQQEFIRLFSRFLENTYLEKFEVYYGDLDKIEYNGEKIAENSFAAVKVTVTTKSKIAHPVEYRMEKAKAGDDWKVYDVVIEGVSLVKNYRDQFEEIIAKSSYEGLISDIKTKLESQ